MSDVTQTIGLEPTRPYRARDFWPLSLFETPEQREARRATQAEEYAKDFAAYQTELYTWRKALLRASDSEFLAVAERHVIEYGTLPKSLIALLDARARLRPYKQSPST